MWLAVAGVILCGRQEARYPEEKLIGIARQAVCDEVSGTSQALSGGDPAKAVFVTIERKGKIRGCRGDLIPRTRTLEEEVALAAKDAAGHDPRYRPMSRAELGEFLVTVTVVEREEPLDGVQNLQPEEGLILRSGGKTGIVLPWEGRDPQVRLKWAYKKAGVSEGSSVTLRRLIAERFRG